MWHESDVREYLEEFNKRVRHARMQLLGDQGSVISKVISSGPGPQGSKMMSGS